MESRRQARPLVPPSTSALRRWVAAAAVVLCGLAVGLGCGSDDVGPDSRTVGGRCSVDNDCDKRCATGADFPGGYCTVSCATDKNCPKGATCASLTGMMDGVCLATCRVPTDCNAYGAGYQCNRQISQSGAAGELACIGGN